MSPLVLVAIGGVYALIFWVVAWQRPAIALMLIFAAAPFQNDISGGGPLRFSIAEINLLLTLPVALVRARRLIFGPTLFPACLYMATCVFSGLGQWRDSGLTSLVQIGLYTVITVFIFASLAKDIEDYKPSLDALIFVSVIISIAVCVTRQGYVFGLHKNGVGASLATTFVITIEMWVSAVSARRRWVYLGSAAVIAVACLITLSRGAWIAAFVGCAIILTMRGRFGLMFKCCLVLLPIVVIGWNLLPEESRQYASSFDDKRLNIKMRYDSIDYAEKLFLENPIQGAGIGLRKDYDATNLVLLTLAETGVPGLLTFVFLHVVITVMVLGAYRKAPANSLSASLLALALGLALGKFVHGLVDHYWSRGSLTACWATVGIATRVQFEQRRARRNAALALAAERQAALAETEIGAPT